MSEEMDLDGYELEEQPGFTGFAARISPPAPVVDFSALTVAEKAVVGEALEKQIKDDSSQVMARYLRVGRNLYMVSKNKLYEHMGHATFEEWRAQPDLNLARATSYALMKVFETFVERLQVPVDKLEGLDWSKLYLVSQFANPKNVDEFIEKVRLLSRADLQIEINTLRAISRGQTPAQAAAQQPVLEVIRESCPIGCGAVCSRISDDPDAAVMAFKKFLGGWRNLQLKIKGLVATLVSAQPKANEPASEEAVPATVPSENDGLAPDDLGEPSA